MNAVFMDFETRSDQPIKLTGSYKYFETENFAPLLLSYGTLDGEVKVHDFMHSDDPMKLPDFVEECIQDGWLVCGWSRFEWLALNRIRGVDLPLEQYLDVMIMAAEMGYPLALGPCGEALGCSIPKDPVGRLAIQRFSKPQKNGKFMAPEEDQKLWDEFSRYCSGDTELMIEIYTKLEPLSSAEWRLWQMDLRMNDRGIKLDHDACQLLKGLSGRIKARCNEMLVEETGGKIETVGQVAKIAEYCGLLSANEVSLQNALDQGNLNPSQALVARVRQLGAKSSSSKIDKMLSTLMVDGRSRGNLQFCGTKTKREAGRNWQPHNLPRESFKPEEFQRCLQLAYDTRHETLQKFIDVYPQPLHAVSMMLRGLIVPEKGKEFIIADYSAIEARILAWIAGQADIVQLYREGKDVYKEMAATVFHKPVDHISDGDRFIGKTLVLGSGYGLGWRGLQRNLARSIRPAGEEDAQTYTAGYRARFSEVVGWWRAIMRNFERVVAGSPAEFNHPCFKPGNALIEMGNLNGDVWIELPTGSKLWYHGVTVEERPAPWDESILMPVYLAKTFGSGVPTYSVTHSILAENICSCIARDIMMRGALRCEQAGYPLIMTVHDEVVLEIDEGFGTLSEVDRLLCAQPYWSFHPDPGVGYLPLQTEAFRSPRYRK